MTREETISILEESKRQNEIMRDNPSTFWASHQMAEGVKNSKRRIEALDHALSALRGPTREIVERMFPGCPYCDIAKANSNIYNKALWVKEAETRKWTLAGKSLQYCPICGRPLTDEAVQMVMERMEALYGQENT